MDFLTWVETSQVLVLVNSKSYLKKLDYRIYQSNVIFLRLLDETELSIS